MPCHAMPCHAMPCHTHRAQRAETRRARIPSARAAAHALLPRWKTREIWRSGRLGVGLASRLAAARKSKRCRAADLAANLGCCCCCCSCRLARSRWGAASDRASRTRFNFAKVRLKSARPSYADAHNFRFVQECIADYENIAYRFAKHLCISLPFNFIGFLSKDQFLLEQRVVVQSFLT